MAYCRMRCVFGFKPFFRPALLQENNSVTVWNNGDGVPVEIHKEENVYVPELIFGHLLTSSNYNDSQKKVLESSSQSKL